MVVLPALPATAIERVPAKSSASASARVMIFTPIARAASSSGSPARTAAEWTSQSAARTCSGSWPMLTRAPSASIAASASDSFRSQPDTSSPRVR